MRTYLLATTAALALAAPAAAETISTAVTQPVRTSTIKAGAPDAITIAAAGSVKPASGTAVTMDSNHAVTNQGAIAISNADGAVGIRALAGTTGDLVNSGTITIDETYAPTDSNNDGDLDGPFAIGTGRYGIRTEGAHSGKLTNSGTITVEGNDSAGIWLGGPLTGAFTHDGTTTVTGDRAVGVRADAISGNARLAGTVAARGVDAVGARLAGDIGGSLVVQGAISASGYRYTTPPANAPSLDADDLLQGGSALLVEGNVAGGIVLAAAPKDSNPADNDEDKDGIEDAKEGTAAVTAFGAAPAMVIGASGRDIAIGAVPGTGSGLGLLVEGAISGNGVYAGIDGNGLVIGGRGGKVGIAGGIGVSGSIAATSNGASATALRLGSGATVPDLRVSGTISAAGGNAATARTTAIQIDAGASLPALRVSGTVKATAGGTAGAATAVIDRSGTLALVENSGAVSATGAAADSGRNVAFDLSANTTGVTLRQTVVTTATAPSITGDLRFGTGNDLFDVADGSVKGDVFMGAGNNAMRLSGDAVHSGRASFGAGADVLSLAGTSVFNGVADFGGGGADSLTLAGTSRFSGGLANAGSLAVSVTGGTLAIASPVAIGSLSVGAGGVLEVTLDKDAGQGTLYTIAGAADFAAGATMNLRLADIDNAEGRYTVLQAGSISGLAGLKTTTGFVPFLFKATVAANAPANTIAVDVARRTVQELGLNRSGASAYDAVFKAVAKDDGIENYFLAIADGDQFRGAVRQILPDHAGGAFEGVSLGARTFARQVAEPQSPVYSVGGFDLLFNMAGWTSQKDEGATADYDLSGFGISLGGEVDSTIGAFGATLGLFLNEQQQGGDNPVTSETYELAVHWRGNWGDFAAHARGSVGRVNFDERRTLAGKYGDKSIERTAEARWNGTLTTLMGGASYELGSDAFFIRPMVGVDYVGLSEEAHTSTGGGKGLDLAVEKRSSDEFAANGGVAVGVDFYGSRRGDQNWLRIEGEGGWREIVGGALGDTVARFGDGQSFTLAPEQTASGWFARLRAMGGSDMFEIGGELGAEDRHDNTALTMRGSLRIGF